MGTFIREGLLIERGKAYKRLLPTVENKVCQIGGGGGYLANSDLCRGLPIRDETRLTTDTRGEFLGKKGFYNTLLRRGCLL